jgi:hypothetical protein
LNYPTARTVETSNLSNVHAKTFGVLADPERGRGDAANSKVNTAAIAQLDSFALLTHCQVPHLENYQGVQVPDSFGHKRLIPQIAWFIAFWRISHLGQ